MRVDERGGWYWKEVKGYPKQLVLFNDLRRIDFHIINYWMSSIYGYSDLFI